MKFDLIRPCIDCPFRNDKPFFFSYERVEEILQAITDRQQTFACHKTVEFDDGEHVSSSNEQHCAGALIMLERMERPNQMMRIAERCGIYDRNKLAMDAPVYDNADDMLAAGHWT